MSTSRPVVKVSFLLILAAILPLTSAQAADRDFDRERMRFTIARLLPEFWSAIQDIWAKEGTGVDPFGHPKPSNATPPPSSTSGTDSSPK